MKKIFISTIFLLTGLATSYMYCRGVENHTPFFAHVTMKYTNTKVGDNGNLNFSLAPGEKRDIEGGGITEGYARLETRNICPDAIRPLLGPNFAMKDNTPHVEMYAETYYWKGTATGGNSDPNATWIIGGPRCAGNRCTTDSSSDSLFKYKEFKVAYDAELKKLSTKPTDQRALAQISAPLIQKGEFWRLFDAAQLAKSGGEVLIKNSDAQKNVYYTYIAGQKTRNDSVKYNSQIKTTTTFAIK